VRNILRITSVLHRFADRQAFQDTLDSLQNEIEKVDQGQAEITLREGQLQGGRCRQVELHLDEARCLAVLNLEVITDDRYTHGAQRFHSESLVSSPQTLGAVSAGNWCALPRIQFTPTVSVIYPQFYDGNRLMTVLLTLAPSDVLVLDSKTHSGTLNGDNILNSVQGDFVQLAPGETNLIYSDNSTQHAGSLYLFWEDRWV
jgi:hypothetical protein